MPDQMNPSLSDLEAEASGARRSLQQTTPPQAVTDVITGMADPVLQAGNYLGGILQGSQRPNWHDTLMAGAGLASMAVPGPGEEAAAARGLARGAERAITTPEGLAIKGRQFTKRSGEVQREMEQLPKGSGPMDLAAGEHLPGAPQADIERYDPTAGRGRGVPDDIAAALAHPEVRNGVKQSIVDGMKMGAHKWYDTRAVREAFRKAYQGSNSDPDGGKAFKHFMDIVAATSPRSDVGTNIRNATYYLGRMLRGEPVEELPYPYGHVAQKLHKQNFRNLSAAAAEGREGWDPIKNPKPASFSPNLQGNYKPVTVDTHAFRNIVMRTRNPNFLAGQIRAKISKAGKILETEGEGELPEEGGAAVTSMLEKYGEKTVNEKGDTIVTIRPRQLFDQGRLSMEEAAQLPSFWRSQPKKNEYAAVERFYQELAREHGLEPAEAQAAAWAGAGKLTGLGSPPAKTFAEIMNERALYTAKMRGTDPQQTLFQALRGEIPLLSLGGLAAGAAGSQGSSLPATAEPTPREGI